MQIEEILKELKPLFEQAQNENLWFYVPYLQLWFTPKELKEQQAQGRFVWGASNWVLRNPFEKLGELERKREIIDKEIKEIQKMLLTIEQLQEY